MFNSNWDGRLDLEAWEGPVRVIGGDESWAMIREVGSKEEVVRGAREWVELIFESGKGWEVVLIPEGFEGDGKGLRSSFK